MASHSLAFPRRSRWWSPTSIAVRWKIVAVLALTAAVAFNALLGLALLELFGFISVTLYGVVVISRKIIQLTFAGISNHRTRRIVREPIIKALVAQYPHLEQEAYRLLRRPMHFADFKTAVLNLLAETYDLLVLEGKEASVAPGSVPAFVSWEWVNLKWRQLIFDSFEASGDVTPYVGVVIPTYRTSKLELMRLIESLENQTYPNIYVCIVLNENCPELKAFTYNLIRKYGGKRYIRFVEPRRGKRNAMRMGFADCLSDPRVKYVFNVDSDSKLEEDAITNAVRLFESNPQIGCLTGNVHVSNPDVNLLTRLTYHRFYYAFNVERAAQNLFYGVTCMSGAFMAVRSSHLRHILNPWFQQRFLGQHCSYGDDRHIATLTLKHGLLSAYCPDSISWTDVPHQMPVWKRQQTRWARSAWRETIITLPWLHRLPLWIIFEVAYMALFPFILWGILGAIAYRAVLHGPATLIPYFVVVIALNVLFTALPGVLSNRDFSFFLTPLYLFYQFVYLQPLRLWALISLDVTRWGTK